MSKTWKIDETGNVYGEITVLSFCAREDTGGSYWNVRCSCGNEFTCNRSKLASGQKTCEQCAQKIRAYKRRKDFIGQRFGKLVVVENIEEYKPGQRKVLCKCDCGNSCAASVRDLVGGSTRSCGCLRKAQSRIDAFTEKVRKHYEGQIIGKITVKHRDPHNVQRFICQCECGKDFSVAVSNLTNKSIHQCPTCAAKQRREKQAQKVKGKQFGRLLVLKENGRTKWGNHRWLCRCSCGREVNIAEHGLLSGQSTKCTRCRDIEGGESHINKLDGQTFGNLKVIQMAGKNKQNNYNWLCECICGEQVIVSGTNLLTGHTKGCGCTRSFAEKSIARILRQQNIQFEREKKFPGCVCKRELPFDFYIPFANVCIECDGQQHFVPVDFWGGEKGLKEIKHRDNIKTKFCKAHNIDLIRIPYTKYKRIEEVLTQEVLIPYCLISYSVVA